MKKQYEKSRMCYLWLFMGAVLFLNISCTRKPKPITSNESDRGIEQNFVDDHADGLFNVELFNITVSEQEPKEDVFLHKEADKFLNDKYSGRVLKLKTSSRGEEVKNSISLKGNFINSKSRNSFINDYQLLNYKVLEEDTNEQKILASLFKIDEGKFRGMPDTVYEIVPRLENNYLIFYRVAELKDIPYIERAVAIKFGNKVATPLLGYPVKYCIAEQEETKYDEKTGKYERECQNISRESAQYIHLDVNNKRVFQYLQKWDHFPRDFFDGQWFYTKTVIKSSGNSETGQHQSFRSANLVEFIPDSNGTSLQVTDTEQYKNSLEEQDRVVGLSIPVKWKEYEIDSDSGVINPSVFGEREDIHNSDVERPYFEIQFEELVKNEVKGNQSADISDVLIEPGVYFSFVVKVSGSSNKWVKYSFKRLVENLDYVEKQWFEEESQSFFPVFFDSRKYYRTSLDITQRDRERFLRTTRFDPRSADDPGERVIRVYFSKQTPKDDWIRSVGRRAVKYWDKVFQEAGKNSDYKIRVVLDETEDQEIGDTRYDMILNLMVSEGVSGSPFFGFGPNISNPITGEVISATANVWVTSIVDSYISLLKKYIRFHIYPPAWKLLPESPGVTDFMHEKIQKLCPEVTSFINAEKAKGEIFHPTRTVINDKKILKTCAPKLAEIKILQTTLHEMGHGFAYRHVFSCSADQANFYNSYDEMKGIFGGDILTDDTESYPNPPQFSCIMDYYNLQFPILGVPGKYDIAATRFIYFDKVELDDGELLDIPAGADKDPANPQKSILDVIQEKQVSLKKYRVCGGKKQLSVASEFDYDDPLCSRHDYGKTPVEVIKNVIRLSQDVIMTSGNRYDAEEYNEFSFSTVKDYFQDIARVHEKLAKYRTEILKKKNLTLNDYSFLDDEDINSYQQIFQVEANNNPEFKAYYEIRKPLLDYYRKLFFLPLKHCVYQKEGEYQAVALEVIKKRISGDYPEGSREIFMNCKSPVVKKWAKENNKGTLVTEVGYFGNHTEYFLKAKQDDPYDEYSFFSIPLNPQSTISWFMQPKPSFLNRLNGYVMLGPYYLLINSMGPALFSYNPGFLREIVEEFQESTLQGIDLNDYLSKEEQDKLDKPLPRFLSYEVDSMASILALIQESSSESLKLTPYPYGHMGKKSDFIYGYIGENKLKTVNNLLYSKKEKILHTFLLGKATYDALSDMLSQGGVLSSPTLNPFIYKAHETYKASYVVNSPANNHHINQMSFIDFLLNHKEVCNGKSKRQVIIPFASAEEGNRMAKICKKINTEYKPCVDNHSDATPCKNVEDKKVFIQFVLQ